MKPEDRSGLDLSEGGTAGQTWDPLGDRPATPAGSVFRRHRRRLALLLARTLGPVVLSVGLGLLLAGVLVRLLGVSPSEFFVTLFAGTFGSVYGLSQVLFRATPLLFTGLAVALAFQARLFNIGAEGQMVVGALAMAWIGSQGPALHFPLGLVLVLAAGFAAGMVWGWIPGVLKARTGSHEVIVTILLNFIALALVNYLLSHHLALHETVRTAEVSSGAFLPRFSDHFDGLRGSPLNAGLLLGLLLLILVHLWLRETPTGLSLQILGEGPSQARYAGLAVSRLTVLALTLSGGVAGLAGASFVLGYKHYFEEGFSGGAGFQGIAVALLARNRPLWILPSAIFFGGLSYGGLVVNRLVPRELLDVLQALILLLFIVFDRAFRELGRSGSPRKVKRSLDSKPVEDPIEEAVDPKVQPPLASGERGSDRPRSEPDRRSEPEGPRSDLEGAS